MSTNKFERNPLIIEEEQVVRKIRKICPKKKANA